MKKYDYSLAKKIIEKFVDLDVLKEASLGMHEDWFWTAETIWEDGEYKRTILSTEEADEMYEASKKARENGMSFLDSEFEKFKGCFIGGIIGSGWATPVIGVVFKDGHEETFNCFVGDGEQEDILKKIENQMLWARGPLSGDVQDYRDNIDVKDFNN